MRSELQPQPQPQAQPQAQPQTRSSRCAWILVAILCASFLGGITFYVLDNDAIVYFDAYSYADSSASLYEVCRDLFHPVADSPGLLANLSTVIGVVVHSPRPPFYLPSTVLAAAFDLEWSVDLIILLDLWIYFPILAWSIGRVLYISTNRSAWAVLAGICALMLSPVLWESSSVCMGDMPMTAITALMVLAWTTLVQKDRWMDYLWMGVVLAWGILTKPVFLFFATPAVLHIGFWFVKTNWIGKEHTRTRLSSTFLLGILIAIPLTVLIATWDNLIGTIRTIYVMNEVFKVFLRSDSLWQDLTWPITLASESYVVYPLFLLAILWLAALFHRRGRVTWIVLALLLGYVSLRLNQRSGRVFEPFLVGFSALSGYGIAALHKRLTKPIGVVLFVAAMSTCIAFSTNNDFLNRTVAKRSVFHGIVAPDGTLGSWIIGLPPPLPAVGNQYETWQIDEVFRITKVMDDPSMRIFLTFSGIPLTASAYESKRRLRPPPRPVGRAFFSNGYRMGGWGSPGGLHPLFSEADFVLARSGLFMDKRLESVLYDGLLSTNLMRETSAFHAGLERVIDLPLPGQQTLRIYKRVRAPSLEEWLAIVVQLFLHDADNPWNAPHIARMLDYAEQTQQPAIGDAAATWILSFAEDPKVGPQLSNRYLAGREFPELRRSYEAACRRAIAWFQR